MALAFTTFELALFVDMPLALTAILPRCRQLPFGSPMVTDIYPHSEGPDDTMQYKL